MTRRRPEPILIPRRTALREPIVIPRWLLVALYVGFFALGIASTIVGVPALEHATWRSYTIGWAAALTTTSIFAAIGALRPEAETVEKWGAVGVTSIISAYTVSAIIIALYPAHYGVAASRWALAIMLIIMTMLPACRAWSLLRRTGLR